MAKLLGAGTHASTITQFLLKFWSEGERAKDEEKDKPSYPSQAIPLIPKLSKKVYILEFAGIVKDRGFVLCCRAIAWIAWYFLPVHVVAVSNLRGFCVYGHEPANASLVCWRSCQLQHIAQKCVAKIVVLQNLRKIHEFLENTP